MVLIKKFVKGNKELRISNDEYAISPRQDQFNLGIMVCFHKRYDLGDKTNLKSESFQGWESLREHLIKKEKAVIIYPLYLYDHSGLRIKIGSFNGLLPQGYAEFDSGQAGFIYTTKDKIKECFGKKKLTKNVLKLVDELLKGEIEQYDQYLNGDVYCYQLVEITKCKECNTLHEEILDSCSGFYGSDINTNGIKDCVNLEGFKEVIE